MIGFFRPLLITLTVAGFVLAAVPDVQAQAALTPADVEEELANFFRNEMNIRRSAVHVEGGKVLLALDVEGLDGDTIIGATGLMLSTAGGAAPWSSEIRMSVFAAKALLYQVAVSTKVVSDLLSGRINDQQFVAQWRFAPVVGTGPTVGGSTVGGQTIGGQAAGGQAGGSASAGTARTLALEPSADSHVYAYSYQNWNASNWGKYEVLGAGWHPVGGEKRAFIKFDLSNLDLRTVVSAKLRLYRYHLAGDGAKALGVFRVTSAWQEGRGTYKPPSAALPGEITWLNQPAYDSRSPMSFSSVGTQPVFVDLDVTWLVKAWASGFVNHGLMLRPAARPDASSPEAMFGFHAREHKNANTRPKLMLRMTRGGSVVGGGSVIQPSGAITWDFETGDLRGWTRTGTAFDYQPTWGDNPTARNRGQSSGHGGTYWIGGFERYQGRPGDRPGTVQGDGPTGTLTSNSFTISGGGLTFLVGGGASLQTRVELLVDGQSVLRASGRNNETMQQVSWDLTPWAGRRGQVRIVDNASGGWGHINVDEFRFTTGAPSIQGESGSGAHGLDMAAGSLAANGQQGHSATGVNTDWPDGVAGGLQEVSLGEIITDRNWKVSAQAPASAAWLYPGFNDATWLNATANWRLRPAPAAHIAGMEDTAASWIWHRDDPDSVYFRREFVLSNLERNVTLRITADNEYVVHVNGTLVGEDAGSLVSVWNTAEAYDVSPFLTFGRNVIAIVARDLGGGSGLLMDTRLANPSTMSDQAVEIVIEPTGAPSDQPRQNFTDVVTPQSPDVLLQQGKALLSRAYGAADGSKRAEAFADALALFEKAQSMGSAEAIYLIGFMYETGNGLRHDNDIAASFYEEAARAGYTKAYRQLILVQNQLRQYSAATVTFFKYYKAFPYDALQGVEDYAYSPEVLRAIQRALHRAGYYHGAIDGIIGAGTRQAIERYVNERVVDVVIDPG